MYIMVRNITFDVMMMMSASGADPGFQVRGGGALKLIVPRSARREKSEFRIKVITSFVSISIYVVNIWYFIF